MASKIQKEVKVEIYWQTKNELGSESIPWVHSQIITFNNMTQAELFQNLIKDSKHEETMWVEIRPRKILSKQETVNFKKELTSLINKYSIDTALNKADSKICDEILSALGLSGVEK
jgi:hypothetical protein